MPLCQSPSMNQTARSFLAGVAAELPLLVGVFPFGMIYGALAVNAGLSLGLAQMMSIVVFAGSAQLVTAQLFHEGAPALVIIMTIGIVNLRHVLYSASVAPYMKDLSSRWRSLLAYLLTDEAYAVTILHYEEVGATLGGHWFFLGAGSALWFTWQASSALGIMLGPAVPASWQLDFALPLTFIAMLIPILMDRPIIGAAVSAGLVAVAAYGLPYRLGLIVAALVGIGVGVLLERRK